MSIGILDRLSAGKKSYTGTFNSVQLSTQRQDDLALNINWKKPACPGIAAYVKKTKAAGFMRRPWYYQPVVWAVMIYHPCDTRLFFPETGPFQGRLYLFQDLRIVDGGRNGVFQAVGDLPHGGAEDLP